MKLFFSLILLVSLQLNAKDKANTNHCETLKADQNKLAASLDKIKKDNTDLDKQIASMSEAIDKNAKACQMPNNKTCNRQMLEFISQQRMATQGKKHVLDNSLIALLEQQKELDRRKQACH